MSVDDSEESDSRSSQVYTQKIVLVLISQGISDVFQPTTVFKSSPVSPFLLTLLFIVCSWYWL